MAARVRQGRSVCREDVSVCFRRYLILLGDASKGSGGCFSCVLQTWQRPTLPRLKTKYHRRWGVSRPCSEWERVQPPRQNHQVGKAQDLRLAWRKPNEKLVKRNASFEHVFTVLWALARSVSSARPKAVAPCGALAHHVMSTSNGNDQANRTISTGKLHALPHFHTQPINVVVFHGSQGNTRFQVGFPLRCLQRLSIPYIATLLCPWQDNRSTRDMSIPVLSY